MFTKRKALVALDDRATWRKLALNEIQTMKPRKKIHLREGTCKRGERGELATHRQFVDVDNKACLTCARICECNDCYKLERVFGSRVE